MLCLPVRCQGYVQMFPSLSSSLIPFLPSCPPPQLSPAHALVLPSLTRRGVFAEERFSRSVWQMSAYRDINRSAATNRCCHDRSFVTQTGGDNEHGSRDECSWRGVLRQRGGRRSNLTSTIALSPYYVTYYVTYYSIICISTTRMLNPN